MANLNIAERRLPQDGRIMKTISGKPPPRFGPKAEAAAKGNGLGIVNTLFYSVLFLVLA